VLKAIGGTAFPSTRIFGKYAYYPPVDAGNAVVIHIVTNPTFLSLNQFKGVVELHTLKSGAIEPIFTHLDA